MVTCPNCQRVNEDAVRFCPSCATPLGQSQAGQPQQGYSPPWHPLQQAYPQAQPVASAPGVVVQPVAPAPFVGDASPPSPARPVPQPQPGVGVAPYPQRSAMPAGFGAQGLQPGGPNPPIPALPAIRKRKGTSPLRFLPFAIGPIIMVTVFGFMFIGGGSCSSVEGQFSSTGPPVGTFTFVPAQCRSGERMDFHGVFLVGKGPTDGGIKVVQDPVKGPVVTVEIPGSCKPPDHEICKEVTIDKSACSTFKVRIERTNTTVNDIRLIDGGLELDCRFREGGTVKAKLDFENCD